MNKIFDKKILESILLQCSIFNIYLIKQLHLVTLVTSNGLN